ncbi:hypothetical protein VTN96DRAFT_9662 [Rasamsonia emersonii]
MSPHKDKNANTNTKFNAVSSTLFKIAALINAKYGHDHIHSALATIAETPDLLIGKYGAWYTWHYIDAMFAVVACLNYQWSQQPPHGPRTLPEKLIFAILVLMSVAGGYKYFLLGAYQPLIPLWGATGFMVGGLVVSVIK